jgi:hypothetical protein
MDDWLKGVGFSVYGWNAAPVDGTNITRSYAAIGREFPFPIDTSLESHEFSDTSNDGERTSEYVDGAFPLLMKQREVLKTLIEDRREHHRDLRNKNAAGSTIFAVGDLVLVRVKVKSDAKVGPAKMRIRARGPYRVLEQLSDNTYRIQKVPFDVAAGGRPHKPYKETAARMQKLPSTVVIHKNTDGVDTRWASARNPFGVAPLQHTLGAVEFGRYRKADPGQKWAFERIQDIWDEPIEDDEDRNPTDDPGPDPGPDPPTEEIGETAEIEDDKEPEEKKGATRQEVIEVDSDTEESPKPKGILRKAGDESSELRVQWSKGLKRPHKAGTPFARPKRMRIAPRDIPTREVPSTKGRRKIFAALKTSRDRLLFVKYRPTGSMTDNWYLAQAQWDTPHEFAQAVANGRLQVRFMVPHHQDSKKYSRAECRWWPEIHEVNLKTGMLGKMVPVAPDKVESFLEKHSDKHLPYEVIVDVPEHILFGPFDYAPPSATKRGASHMVRIGHWDELKTAARAQGIDVSDVDEIIALLGHSAEETGFDTFRLS